VNYVLSKGGLAREEAISEETDKRLVEAAEGVVKKVGVELGFRNP